MPPAARRASRRTSMQPPAAAAVLRATDGDPGERVEHLRRRTRRRGSRTAREGPAAQPRHQRVERQPRRLSMRATSRVGLRMMGDVGVGQPAARPARRSPPTPRAPAATAQSLPVQPGGSGGPVERSLGAGGAAARAIPPVPSRAVVVDHARRAARRDSAARAASRPARRSSPPRRAPG